MELYSEANGLQNLKVIKHSGGSSYPDKISEADLNTIGYYKVFRDDADLKHRYYDYTPSEELIDNVYTISYTQSDKPVDKVKALMYKDLEDVYEAKGIAPVVDTELGYYVRGSRNDLDSFERGNNRGRLDIRDATGMKRTVSGAEFAQIITKVEDNGEAIFDAKWAIFDTFMAFTEVAECVAYENEPNGTYTAQDELDGLGVEGESKYKNNVKEW